MTSSAHGHHWDLCTGISAWGRAGSGHSICWGETRPLQELAPCECRAGWMRSGMGVPVPLSRWWDGGWVTPVGELAPVGTSVLLASCRGWVWLSPGLLPSALSSHISEARLQWESGCCPASRTCVSSDPASQNCCERSRGGFLLSPSTDADFSPAGGGSGHNVPAHPCMPSAEHGPTGWVFVWGGVFAPQYLG